MSGLTGQQSWGLELKRFGLEQSCQKGSDLWPSSWRDCGGRRSPVHLSCPFESVCKLQVKTDAPGVPNCANGLAHLHGCNGLAAALQPGRQPGAKAGEEEERYIGQKTYTQCAFIDPAPSECAERAACMLAFSLHPSLLDRTCPPASVPHADSGGCVQRRVPATASDIGCCTCLRNVDAVGCANEPSRLDCVGPGACGEPEPVARTRVPTDPARGRASAGPCRRLLADRPQGGADVSAHCAICTCPQQRALPLLAGLQRADGAGDATLLLQPCCGAR